jgi:hypothetical protein
VTDWTTISSLATASGTLILAVATFAAVRSANASARVTERALLAGTRPVIVTSRLDDPPEKVGFADQHYVRVGGGRAAAEITDDAIYLAVAIRNVGTGLAVLDRWALVPERLVEAQIDTDLERFHRLSRDLYIAAGDRGFWQGALRDPSAPGFVEVAEAIRARGPMTLDLIYADHEGGQRMVTRFGIVPVGDDGEYLASTSLHRNIDRDDPR